MVMDHSSMHDRLKKGQRNILELYGNVEELREEDKSIREYIDENIRQVRQEHTTSIEEQEVKNQQNISRFEQVFKVLKEHQVMIQKL